MEMAGKLRPPLAMEARRLPMAGHRRRGERLRLLTEEPPTGRANTSHKPCGSLNSRLNSTLTSLHLSGGLRLKLTHQEMTICQVEPEQVNSVFCSESHNSVGTQKHQKALEQNWLSFVNAPC